MIVLNFHHKHDYYIPNGSVLPIRNIINMFIMEVFSIRNIIFYTAWYRT